jgi:hypothetical protein
MRKRYVASAIVLAAVLMSAPLARAQNTPPERSGAAKDQQAAPVTRVPQVHVDGWGRPVREAASNQKVAPAQRHDLSGIWEPAKAYRDGVQATGAKEMPSDGKPEHELPFTPVGEQAFKANKPGFGTTAVPIALNNDPFDICDPLGLPRVELFNLRAVQILQTKTQVLILYENDQVWRTIWMDGREFPKNIQELEPRWFGYSVGKWEDDTTFVVQTVGLDERSWIDNAGRPHSSDLRVEERFHRVNNDILEVTLTIIDPKMYSKPWVALNKYPLRLQSESFDIREMICSPSEAAEYNKQVAAPDVGVAPSPKP